MRSLLAALLPLVAAAQVPVPATPPGFVIANGAADANAQLDMFVDLLCPYSKMAYPALKQVVHQLLPSQLRLRVHQFPLPYHHQAYSVAQASETIAYALGPDSFEAWMDAVYAVQDSFGNKVTENDGQKLVTAQIKQLAQRTFPNLTDAQWDDGMAGGSDRDGDTRVAWKYACSRGISGTPMFLLNDVAIDADPAWTTHDWLVFLKPYVDPKQSSLAAVSVSSSPAVTHGTWIVVAAVAIVVAVAVAARRRMRQMSYRQLA
ncbi:Aste57867_14990 [Aphanomyces stellatus]|uniref:Aste57867_14990 protein n=1 Tax=Aphanomyces stellatus TaxID=120398 RepID=A0A485L236_9STRA|nr:hypothetical protein As57867_014934 [Aphanomyces stellatus]VFT91804.1 Aste57867_14990 [Aphanomyces stellatus]